MTDRGIFAVLTLLAIVVALFAGVGVTATVLLIMAWLDRKRPYSL